MFDDILGVSFTIKFDSIFGLIASILFIVLMAVVSSRLLGVVASRWRSLWTSVLGWIAGLSGASLVEHKDVTIYFTVAALFGLLATMTLRIAMEMVVPSRVGAHRLRRLLHPIAWVRRKVAPIGRFRQVMANSRRRGLVRLQFASPAGIATRDFGRRLRLTLEDSGGMFVKFGQIASTRADLLDEAVIDELSHLRASVRPIDSGELRPLLEAELGRRVEEAFASFEWEPLAAASIGQTHRAVLPGGERVVVKIQRPGMTELLARDATVLRLLASTAERRVEAAGRLGVRALADELVLGMERELDYRREATMSRRLASELDPDGAVVIPAVHDELSTERLLVMEEVPGSSVDDPLAIAQSGAPPDELARSLLRSFFEQVLRGGAYHADPHPGNVMVDSSGRLWLLDFGAVGLVDPVAREALQEIALGMATNEPLIVARALRRITGSTSEEDVQLLESNVGLLMVESSAGFDPKVVQDVLSLMILHGMRVPPSMTQLSRALLTLQGTLQTIAPWFDLASESTELVRKLTGVEELTSEGLLQRELVRAMPILRSMPQHADELATQLRTGRMTVRVDRYSGPDRAVLGHWIDRVLLAAVGIGGAVASALLLVASGTARSSNVGEVLRAIGFIGVVFSAVLLMRTVAQVLRREGPAPKA